MKAKQTELQIVPAILEEDIHKKSNRLEFIRVETRIQDHMLFVRKTGSQSSAWLSSMSKATALLPVAPNINHITKGSTVLLQLLP